MYFVQQFRRFGSATSFILFVIISTIMQSQDLPKAPHAQIFTLTPTPGYFTEPAIAVNPTNPQQVVGVFQDNAHAAYSWQAAEGLDPKNYRVSGDVSVAFDHQGHAFICYIAFDKLGTFNYWAHGATRNGIFVRRSLDGGKTWEVDHIPVAEQPSSTGIPFEDKPYIVADNTKSKYAGNLYIGWTRWRIADSQMVLSRSTDDGKTWSTPIPACRAMTTAPPKDSMAWSVRMASSTPYGARMTRSCSPLPGTAARPFPIPVRSFTLRRSCLRYRLLSARMDFRKLPSTQKRIASM
jgi:hypothetical protein